jgi:transcription antitermination protein NusB
MGARSVAREAALMLLFAAEGAGESGPSFDELAAHYWRTIAHDADIEADLESRAYAEEIARGVLSDLTAIDAIIRKSSANWRLERMRRVDRNVLRIGVWELRKGIPRAVAIDEAIELGKRFGTEDTGAFVNGILEKIASDLGVI